MRTHPLWNRFEIPSMEEINAARVKLDVGAQEPVEVVPPDPTWAASFATARERICQALGERVLAVEHVGSTAVEGLWAKPVIDIDLTVADSAAEESWLPDLEAAGFVLRVREPEWEDHRLVRGEAPASNVHVFSAGAREPRRQVMFRDWLRTHPDDRDHYSAFKREIAERGFTDVMLYNNAKAGFVYDLYEKVFAGDDGHRHDPHPRVPGAALEVWLAARVAAGEPPSPARIDRVREKVGDPSAYLVLAERAGRVVGMALVDQFRTDAGHGAAVPAWGHVSMVFVEPAAQGSGVGGELFERLIADGPWVNLSLWTRCSNTRAQALYRGQGFRPTGEYGSTPTGAATERWERREA